ncbi:MAG: 1-acyl-sn-glycerol-3-phosphate acyltransferase [Anaerolineaceae bacterium]|nr:1-acyl-sn-glycerol-3-phosphate acyltransferase [Anaerolineaceae bacterium]
MKREQLRNIIGYLMDHFAHVEYQNLDLLPAEGPVIIATNHLSRADIPVLLCNPKRPEITALVAKKYENHFLFNWILKTSGAIFLDRSTADFKAFRDAKRIIQEGIALGIAPEGTRSNSGMMIPGKGGAAMLAMQLQVPIVPVGLIGTDTFFKKLAGFRKPEVIASFGKHFYLPKLERGNHENMLASATDEIMCRIAALLPERYRGYYKDHPRLQELLNDQDQPGGEPGNSSSNQL